MILASDQYLSRVRRFVASTVLMLVVAMAVSCGIQDPKRNLSISLVPGTAFDISYEDTLKNALGSLKAYADYRFTVDRVDDSGTVFVSVRHERWQIPFQGRLSKALKGQSIEFRMSPSGRILAVENADELQEQVRNRIQKEWQGTPNLRPITADALKYRFNTVLDIWPEVPVTVGDTWTREPILNPALGARELTTFTLDSWNAGKAIVSFESTLEPAQSMESTFIEGTRSGSVVIAPSLGMITRYDATTIAEVVPANQEEPIQLEVSTSVTFSIK